MYKCCVVITSRVEHPNILHRYSLRDKKLYSRHNPSQEYFLLQGKSQLEPNNKQDMKRREKKITIMKFLGR